MLGLPPAYAARRPPGPPGRPDPRHRDPADAAAAEARPRPGARPWSRSRTPATRRQTRLAGGRQPIGRCGTSRSRAADGPSRPGSTPRAPVGSARPRRSLLFFLHGGGMVFGDLDTHDATCRLLAERAGVLVLAVDYRLAPEHPFPAGRRLLGGAPVGCRARRDVRRRPRADRRRRRLGRGALRRGRRDPGRRGGVPCAFQLLVYPVTDMVDDSESRRLFTQGFFLTRSSSSWLDAYSPPATTAPTAEVSVPFTERLPGTSRPRSSSPRASTRCATRARPTRTLADAGCGSSCAATPAHPRVLQRRRRGPLEPRAVAEIAAKLKAALDPLPDVRSRWLRCPLFARSAERRETCQGRGFEARKIAPQPAASTRRGRTSRACRGGVREPEPLVDRDRRRVVRLDVQDHLVEAPPRGGAGRSASGACRGRRPARPGRSPTT